MTLMKRHAPLLALALFTAAFAVQANDGIDLATKSKSMAAASSLLVPAPFVPGAPSSHSRDPLPEILMRQESEQRSRGGCDASATDLCYDMAEGRVVYRGARQYMPRIQGFTAESVSLRHDRIVFRYSF
jgi:hypothetical protein